MRFKSILFITWLFCIAHASANNNFSIKTVVIDAGHGGKDPGATGPGKTNEKDIALIVALKLGSYITENYPDVNVIYTRKTDVFIELHERAEIANKAKADLFIAIHCNSSPNPDNYGTSSYVLGLHRTEANLEVAKRENSVILLEDDRDKNYEFDPNSPEGHIIMSMKQNAFLDQSIDFASKVENQFENSAKRKSLGVKQAGFYVLYKTTMPSLLAEIGFVSNPEEETFLKSAKGQEQIATGLLNAFRDYKAEMEGGMGEKMAAQQEKETAPAKTETKKEEPVVKKEPVVKTETKTEVVTKEETKTEPVIVTKTEPVKTETKKEEPVEKTIMTNPDFITTKSGKVIRKPIENSNGGGTATAKAETKAEVKTETNAEVKKEVKTETKVEKKPEPKEEVKTETKKEEPFIKTETKTEAKTEVKPEKKLEPVEEKTEIKAETKTVGNTIFKVQLFALKGELKQKEHDKATKLFKNFTNEGVSNGLTRYYAGNEKTYSSAKKILELAKSSGYADAYIIGFKDGARMSKEQMKAFEQ